MRKQNGGPAFPRTPGSAGNDVGSETWLRDRGLVEDGMSLRDYFAGQALVGIITAAAPARSGYDCGNDARIAYEYADAMIAERETDRESD